MISNSLWDKYDIHVRYFKLNGCIFHGIESSRPASQDAAGHPLHFGVTREARHDLASQAISPWKTRLEPAIHRVSVMGDPQVTMVVST